MWACANFRTTRFCRWATRQWRSHQNTYKTFPSKSFSLRFLLNVSLFLLLGCNLSYIVDVFAALYELASAGARTLLKLALSVRAPLKPYGDILRWFPGFALRIPTAHDFASSARAHERARVQNIRDFPQTKLISEIKSSFSLKRARWPPLFIL